MTTSSRKRFCKENRVKCPSPAASGWMKQALENLENWEKSEKTITSLNKEIKSLRAKLSKCTP